MKVKVTLTTGDFFALIGLICFAILGIMLTRNYTMMFALPVLIIFTILKHIKEQEGKEE